MENSAAAGGGLYNWSNAVTLIDTVICSNSPDQINGGYIDGGGNIIAAECLIDCLGDIDGNSIVNVSDVLLLIEYWGSSGSPGDINQDGIVDVSDLLMVVANWGECE
jgi:hypothetical protein